MVRQGGEGEDDGDGEEEEELERALPTSLNSQNPEQMHQNLLFKPSSLLFPQPNSQNPLETARASSVARLRLMRVSLGKDASFRDSSKRKVNIVVHSRFLGRWKYWFKQLIFFCRLVVVISPSLTIAELQTSAHNSLIFDINLGCVLLILIRILWAVKKKKRHYFDRVAPCIDLLANVSVFFSALICVINTHFLLCSPRNSQYYFWAICCFFNILAIMNHLGQFKVVAETLGAVGLAFRLNGSFLYVVVLVYLISAKVGLYLFGGRINSKSPERMSKVGQPIQEIEVYQNWNDFLNSLVYLWGINLNNNLPMYISISSIDSDPTRDYTPLFFFFFYMINNVILRNIFIGQIIDTALQYFKQIDKEERMIKQINDDTDVSVVDVKI